MHHAPFRVLIDHLGAEGDGIAHDPAGRTVVVPGALPGEDVTVQPQQTLAGGSSLLAAVQTLHVQSADRRPPPCPHAADCGGCTLQPLAPTAVSAFKKALVRRALDRQRGPGSDGLRQLAVADVESVPEASRRRIGWAIDRSGGHPRLALSRRFSHALVPLDGCRILTPALQRLMAVLPPVLADPAIARLRPIRLVAQHVAANDPIDVLLHTERLPDLAAREHLAALAVDPAATIGRLSLHVDGDSEVEPIAAPAPPRLVSGPLTVPVAANSFLQATAEGQAWMTQHVLSTLAELRKGALIHDLFCGLGAFTGAALAAGHPVSAVEGDPAAIMALTSALQHADGMSVRQSRALQRNLMRSPLTPDELAGSELVIINPPRAGALAQCEQLARITASTGRPRVLMLSCAPATFARDVGVLLAAGWQPAGPVAVLDQFIGSAHVELACQLVPG